MITVETFFMGKPLEESFPEKVEQDLHCRLYAKALEDSGRGSYHTELFLTLINPKILPVISHLCPIIQNNPITFLNQWCACTRQQHTQQ